MRLDGRIAAITGGTAGIGRGIAEAFLAEGASVALMARSADKAQLVLDELSSVEGKHGKPPRDPSRGVDADT